MRQALLLVLAFPALAIAVPYPYTMTGDQFIKMMAPPNPTGYEYQQREKAYGYLDGMRDGSEGTAWCHLPQPLSTADLAYGLADELAKLPAIERRKSAAVLLLQQLKKRYPCRGANK